MERSQRRMKQSSKLNLVSLMDIFPILVFFLMVNSGDVEVLQSDKDIKLPESNAETKPDVNLIIKISADHLVVQGRQIALVENILSSEDDTIMALAKELEYQALRAPKLTEDELAAGRAVTIMGDHSIPYALLKRVMATCAQADYRKISMAVNKMPAPETDSLPTDSVAFVESY